MLLVLKVRRRCLCQNALYYSVNFRCATTTIVLSCFSHHHVWHLALSRSTEEGGRAITMLSRYKNEKDSWCHFIWFFILGTWSSSWLILYKTEQNWPAASTHWGKGRANLETRSIGANLILLATHYLLHFGSIRHCKKGLIFILFHWSGHRHGFFSIF